jgi:putative acetyltransferase
MSRLVIAIDDPGADDVRALLEQHVAFSYAHTPREYAHVLDLDGLLDPAITFFSGREEGRLIAVGALKALDSVHGELKSMHTTAAARGRGVGRAMVDHLVEVARGRGYGRLSLETGVVDAFAPARSLYARAGFITCGPFADYEESPTSAFMTLQLV